VRQILAGSNDGSPKWLTIARNQHVLNYGAQQASVNNPDLFNTECSVMPVIAYPSDHRGETLDRVVQAAAAFAKEPSAADRQFLLAAAAPASTSHCRYSRRCRHACFSGSRGSEDCPLMVIYISRERASLSVRPPKKRTGRALCKLSSQWVHRMRGTMRGPSVMWPASPCEIWARGGSGGIRTHGGREPSPVFKTGAFNHSATLPR